MDSKFKPWLKLVHHWPTRLICLGTLAAQAGSLDYYLISYLGSSWFGMIAADVVIFGLFIAAMYMAHLCIEKEKPHEPEVEFKDSMSLPLGYIAWLIYAIILDVKISVIFSNFASELEEDKFFGENTLKTSIALAGILFVTLLATQHNTKPKTERRAAIEELTATLLFDVLDGVDTLEILLDKESHDKISHRMKRTVIAVACTTFLLPTLSFLTLSITRYGLKESRERLVRLSKITVGYCINLPLFIVRMIHWHGLSEGVSIFALKNLIVIGMVTFELLEARINRSTQQELTHQKSQTQEGNLQEAL